MAPRMPEGEQTNGEDISVICKKHPASRRFVREAFAQTRHVEPELSPTRLSVCI